ncbi:phage holin family protein [Lactiplantibacillus plantarum]|nr:phage holin family protein [Lactiplantibacillus plantarum]
MNGKLIAGLISLLIVLVQQVFAMFGIKFTGDWTSIVAVVNTVLTILGLLGVVTDVQTVNVSQDTTGTLEQATNDVDSTSQAGKAPTSASVSNVEHPGKCSPRSCHIETKYHESRLIGQLYFRSF